VTTYNVAILPPVMWIGALVVTIWLRPPPDDNPAIPRQERRQREQAQHRSRTRRAWYSGSIRDHDIHRKYPISLRSMGHFIRRNAPTVDQRQLQDQVNSLHDRVLRLQQQLQTLLRPHSHTAVPDRGGEVGVQVRQNRAGCFQCGEVGHWKRNCKNRPHYRPVPAAGVHGMGNSQWTHKQQTSAKKMATHCNMTIVNMGAFAADNAAVLRAALQSPHRFRDATVKSSTYQVIWDSGASISISPDRQDFVGPLVKPSVRQRLQGIAKGLNVEGHGHVLWACHDTSGQLRLLKVPAYYVPKCRVRLLSTTSLLQTYADEKITVQAHCLTLSGIASDPTRGAVVAEVDPRNNLPTSMAYRYNDEMAKPQALQSTIVTVNAANINLSEPEKELLRWHCRLGHVSFRRVQFLMRTGVLSNSESSRRLHTAACKLASPPKCAACQYGKQTRRPSPGTKTTVVQD